MISGKCGKMKCCVCASSLSSAILRHACLPVCVPFAMCKALGSEDASSISTAVLGYMGAVR